MNSHQRKKFAKALMSELRNATEDEKIQALVDAAQDMRSLQIRNANLVSKVEELERGLEEIRRTERERVAKVCDEFHTESEYPGFKELSAVIRAME